MLRGATCLLRHRSGGDRGRVSCGACASPLTKVNLGIDTHGEGVVDGPIGTYVLGARGAVVRLPEVTDGQDVLAAGLASARR